MDEKSMGALFAKVAGAKSQIEEVEIILKSANPGWAFGFRLPARRLSPRWVGNP